MSTKSKLSVIRRSHGLIGHKRSHMRKFRIISCNCRELAFYSASYHLCYKSRS